MSEKNKDFFAFLMSENNVSEKNKDFFWRVRKKRKGPDHCPEEFAFSDGNVGLRVQGAGHHWAPQAVFYVLSIRYVRSEPQFAHSRFSKDLSAFRKFIITLLAN